MKSAITNKFLLLFLCLQVFTCSFCATEVGNPPDSKIVIDGIVSKGPIHNSNIQLYLLNEDGSAGEKIASTRSNENAEFVIELSEKIDDALLLVASEGEFKDEASGNEILLSENDSLRLFIDTLDTENTLAITALTEIASQRVVELIKNSDKTEKSIKTAIEKSNRKLAESFGLSSIKIKPENPAKSNQSPKSERTKYTLIQAAISSYSQEQGSVHVLKMLKSLSEDYADEIFDGKYNGQNIFVDDSFLLDTKAVQMGLKAAMKNFISSSNNETGIKETQADDIIQSIPIFE